ncbi:DUF6417 family protein [Streptomyces sp. NBC_01462]|uniref:DUF6417 family protein n=1 Tax=Streptomyces sp. NBC_01462 TaxID=2903876 RepID=UPI002E36A2B1|nr:DUF6417 family protein [Streptomyces sp. NBC_01462]
MRNWEKVLPVLEALYERGQATGHGWTLDTEFLLPHQQHAGALASQSLVELAGREDRAELSVLVGQPVRWAARLTPHGHDTLIYGRIRPRADQAPHKTATGQMVELMPSQMAALRVFTGLAGQLQVPPADGLAEQVRAASCDHGIKRWRLHLTPEQIESVAYGFWLHGLTGSAAEANRFNREYDAIYRPPTGGAYRQATAAARTPS